MKRIEKVSSLVGMDLFKNNGEVLVFNEEDVIDVSTERFEGKLCNTIKLINGYKIIYRNTLQCTFYEIIEGEPVSEELGAVETACAEIKEELNLENICLDLDERKIVRDFYQNKFKSIINLENEENMFFGFVTEDNKVLIPSQSLDEGELCFIYNYDDIKPIITEEQVINNYICNLKRADRKFDTNEYILNCTFRGKKYILNKEVSEEVVSFNNYIGFLVEDEGVRKIIVPKTVKTNLFEIMFLEKTEITPDISFRTIYKKYVSTKKTKGITSIDYKNMFSYFNF